MYEEKSNLTLSSDVPPRHANARATTAATTGTTKRDDDGDLLMRRKIDPDCDVIVIDIGTASIKAGWAGEDAPRCIVPAFVVYQHTHTHPSSVKGSPALSAQSQSHSQSVPLIGTHALESLHSDPTATLRHALHRSFVADYDALYHLLAHVFHSELCVNPKEHSVLLAYSPLYSASEVNELVAFLYDRFSVSSLTLVNTASLSLFSTGHTTGLLVDCSEGRTTVTPIYEGFVLKHAMVTQQSGGHDIDRQLKSLLARKGFAFNAQTPSQLTLLKDIKEKMCKANAYDSGDGLEVCAVNVSRSSGDSDISDRTYELPSGDILKLDDECVYDSADVLFSGRYHTDATAIAAPQASAGGRRSSITASPANSSNSTANISASVSGDDGDDHLRVRSAASNPSLTTATTTTSNGGSRPHTTLSAQIQSSVPTTLTSLSARTIDHIGISALIYHCLSMIDSLTMRKEFASRIVLAGGVSLTSGITDRVRNDLLSLSLSEGQYRSVSAIISGDIKIHCDSQRLYAAWIGGSMFGSLTTFTAMRCTAEQHKSLRQEGKPFRVIL